MGLLAVAFGVCCGLPLVGSLGLAAVLAALSVGSWVLVAAAVAVAAVGFRRITRQGPHCEVTTSAKALSGDSSDHLLLSPVVCNSNGAVNDEQRL